MFKHIYSTLRCSLTLKTKTYSTMKKINLFAIMLLAASGSALAQTQWNTDQAHSKIGFTVTHMTVAEVEGNFKDYTATVTSKSDDFNGADVSFVAKTASINTDNDMRNNHLKSDDFFNAEKYPDITFKGVLVKENGKYQLRGKLTIREVTKDVAFDVAYGGTVDTGRGVKAGFKLTGKINRLDYGLKWKNALQNGSLVVADEVQLNVKIELNKAA
jgi:polyisoprenoid-binding protein YceI